MDSELIDFLSKKFDKIETEINVSRTNMMVGFKDAKEDRKRIENKVDNLFNAVDGFTKIVTKLETEFTVLKEDLNRIKTVLREKLGVEL